jgi:PIN domain nuclease of toxin-antitoxin system
VGEETVLDASAVLALLQDERGKERVEAVLGRAAISAVNYSEVLKKLYEKGLEMSEALRMTSPLRLDVVPFTEETAAIAAFLAPVTKPLGLSLGDRACLATAIQRAAVALTTDRSWTKANLPVQVQVIR